VPDFHINIRLEEADFFAEHCLRPVHGEISVAHQFDAVRSILGI
jgi:hypothetical protein